MKTYLVIKRFAMDDVPVLITQDFNLADKEAKYIEENIGMDEIYATESEQRLMRIDISSELVAVGIITFGDDGRPEV